MSEMGIFDRGQSLDGDSLDLTILDLRVSEWKTELGLFNQPEFPSRNIRITESGIRFHDRSHVLVQDFLGKSSQEMAAVYVEMSLPSIYEEILTYFCAKVTHHPEVDPVAKTGPPTVEEDIYLMRHLGYLVDSSVFIEKVSKLSREISEDLRAMALHRDFPLFRRTLMVATRDCPGWNDLEVIG